ncbi:MAG: hypothetical protein HWN66_12310 [Candidatus Helarchaeota archaeon]|nr:hypothetical protein [Candidatus Helarchaeota archaeon]
MVYLDLELLGITLPTAGFLIASLLMFRKAWKTRENTDAFRTNLFFAIGFVFQAIGFFFWFARLLLYPPNILVSDPEFSQIELLFKLAYTFSGIGLPFITFFGISLAKGSKFFQKHKWIYILPYIGYAILFYVMYFVIELLPIYHGANSTLEFTFNLGDPTGLFISLYMTGLLIIPMLVFIYYLKQIGRDSPQFKRVFAITIGMLVYTLFIILEGGKFIPDLIFDVRIGIFFGMLILIYSLYFMKIKK